jgi:hypothetical protein
LPEIPAENGRFSVLPRGPGTDAHAFASRHVVANEVLASLITASADLKLVQNLRAAINGNGSGPGGAVSQLGPRPNNIDRRFHVHPEPEILPRRRIEPEPRIEPRRVIHPVDRFEPSNRAGGPDVILVPVPVECYKPCKRSVIEPPWKVLPWEDRLPPTDGRPITPKIKIEPKPPDIVHKGSLIDFFI